MDAELTLPAMTPVQELASMKRRSAEIEKQISEAEEAYGIKLLREQKAAIDAEFVAKQAEIAPGLAYSEDSFLKAIKRKGDSYREGKLKMIRTSRTARNVLTEKFAAAFPDLLKSVCKIELTKADALVGKKTMEQYVEKKTTYSYELIDMGDL